MVFLTDHRQAGKTTLAKTIAKELKRVRAENGIEIIQGINFLKSPKFIVSSFPSFRHKEGCDYKSDGMTRAGCRLRQDRSLVRY